MTTEDVPRPFVIEPGQLTDDQAGAVVSGCVVARTEAYLTDVTGPGAVACLQGIITNDLEAPGDGAFLYAATLTPKGMIVADLWAAREDATVTLTAPLAARSTLADVFRRQLPPRMARATDRAAETVVLRLAGPRAIQVAESAGLTVPAPGRAGRNPFRPGDGLVCRPAGTGPFGLELHAPSSETPRLVAALQEAGATEAPAAALELGRILAGWPRLGAEIDERTLPQEVRYEEINGVSFTKGCYTGQETVARLHFRGHTNRNLRGLWWTATPEPSDGSVSQGDKVVGRVSSLAWCAPAGRYVGLALLRRETDPALPVRASGAEAQVVPLPMAPGA